MTPLLLLHGFTGAPAAWDPLLEHLQPGPVLRPALGGHGGPHTSWSEEVDRLLALVDDGDLQGVHLVGYSMGGRLGYSLLSRRSPRITRATLIGAHPGLDNPNERAVRRCADQAWIAQLAEGMPAFVDAWSALPIWKSQTALPSLARAARREIRMQHDPAGLRHALRAYGLATMPPAEPERVDVPVTLVVGQLDTKHRAIAEHLLPRFSRGRLEVIPGSGHDVTLEAPAALAKQLASPEAVS